MLQNLRQFFESRTLRKYRLPDALWDETLSYLPFLAKWPNDNLQRLRALSTLFLVEKNIISGHDSLVVSPLMRTLIAAQACTLVVNKSLAEYEGFRSIVVHPDSFVPSQDYIDEAGVVHEGGEPIAGETSEDGPILLSWPDVWESTDFESSGMNLVVHEFAHKLDMQNGHANGIPPLSTRAEHERWSRALKDAFTDFCRRVDSGEETHIDSYASEHESEFFAVCAEVYVASPDLLLATYPDFYRELNSYFKLWNDS